MQILVNCTNDHASFVASYRARGAMHRVRSPTATLCSSSFVTHKLVLDLESQSVGLMIAWRWHFGLLLFWLRPFHHKRLLPKKKQNKKTRKHGLFFAQVIREHIHQYHTFTVSNDWIRPMWEQWSLDSDSTTLLTLTNWTSKSAITTGYSRSLAPVVYLSFKCSRSPFHLLLINMQRVGER